MVDHRQRRGKRDKNDFVALVQKTTPQRKKKLSNSLARHGKDAPSGGMEAIIPSLLGLAVLVVCVMAQRGFRGRASVAGIDLGTTHSVICVQAPSKAVGEIVCIPDPSTGSPIIPSVVSFLMPEEKYRRQTVKKADMSKSPLEPHPFKVVVGASAKERIDTHPLHTLYNAKRVVGRRASDPAIEDLRREVEFQIRTTSSGVRSENGPDDGTVSFQVDEIAIFPHQVGSYIVYYLMEWTKLYLGHDNVRTAVVAVPAKFNAEQRQATKAAFEGAGIKVARILEEPTAAALAYGLDKKDGVELILVYDFGGGTLDVSLLHITEGGYCDILGSDGDDRLGGADFDSAVAHLLIENHAEVLERMNHANAIVDPEELASTCPDHITKNRPLCTISSFHTLGEQLKISLSQQLDEHLQQPDANNRSKGSASLDLIAQAECIGLPADYVSGSAVSMKDLCPRLETTSLSITLRQYDQAVASLYDRALSPIHRLLKDLSYLPTDMDEIVLVGGTTRMPQIRALVQSAFPQAPLNTHIDPDLTVAYGAASVND
jgi:molecular chaperone DnaK (HSP70)